MTTSASTRPATASQLAADAGVQTTEQRITTLAPLSPPLRPFSADVLSIASSEQEDHTGKTWSSHVAHNTHGVTDSWLPLILALDGGGIRGYSSLVILLELMEQVAKWEIYYEEQEYRRRSRPGSSAVSPERQGLDSRRHSGSEPAFIRPEREEAESRRHSGLRSSATIPARKTFDAKTLLPCHYFDFMYGTSTGGLIATLLGRLRLSVPVCLDIYKDVGNELFGKKRSWIPGATKYDHEPLERRVRQIVAEHCPRPRYHKTHGPRKDGPEKDSPNEADRIMDTPIEDDQIVASSFEHGQTANSQAKSRHRNIAGVNRHNSDQKCTGEEWHPWYIDEDGTESLSASPDSEPFHRDTADRLCHSILLTAVHNRRDEAYLLRTYNHEYPEKQEFTTDYNTGADRLRIWQATRATSAAPFFFKSMTVDINGEMIEFKDGGIRENNPAVAAWSEFMSIYSRASDHSPLRAEPALLLSVGTGLPDMTNDGFAETTPFPLGHWKIVRKFADIFSIVKHMKIKYTSGEEKHESLIQQALGMHSWYKRLNVNTGLQGMRLDNWVAGPELNPLNGEEGGEIIPGGSTLAKLYKATKAYLVRDAKDEHLKEYAPPKEMLNQAAQKLVLHRRAREKLALEAQDENDLNRLRWDNYMGRNL